MIIFLAKYCQIGQALEQQFCHHGGDAIEMARACGATKLIGKTLDADLGCKVIRLDFIRCWAECHIGADPGELVEIHHFLSWVGFEIFTRRKLGWIDKN